MFQGPVGQLSDLRYLCILTPNSLVGYSIQGSLVIETKVARMKDVVRFGCFGELV